MGKVYPVIKRDALDSGNLLTVLLLSAINSERPLSGSSNASPNERNWGAKLTLNAFIASEIRRSKSLECECRRHHVLIEDIRASRQAKGWLQRSLVSRARISSQAIYRLERGIVFTKTLEAAVKALDYRLKGVAPGRTLAEQLRNRWVKQNVTIS